MSDAACAGRAFVAVVQRDLAIFMSYRTRVFSQAMSALFSLALFLPFTELLRNLAITE